MSTASKPVSLNTPDMSMHKALVLHALEQPPKFIERPTPVPKDDEILLKVEIVGLNPHDASSKRLGTFIKDNLPSPFGIDLVGEVIAFGSSVKRYNVGDRVIGLGNPMSPDYTGTQKYCVIPALQSAPLPKNISEDEAATFPLNATTMIFALFHETGLGLKNPLGPNGKSSDYSNESILFIGGGSATGRFGLQLARLAKFKNIIAVASKAREAELKDLGATLVIDRSLNESEIENQVRAVTGDELIYSVDCVGRGTNGQTLGVKPLSSHKKGTMAALVRLGSVDESRIGQKSAGYVRQSVLCHTSAYPDITKEFWAELPALIESGTLTPTGFKVVNGLDAKSVDTFLDNYSNGIAQVKPHIHIGSSLDA